MTKTPKNLGEFPKDITHFEHVTTVDLIDNYKFRMEFDKGTFIQPSSGILIADEPAPFGESSGPNPAQLLSGAVGSCASVAFLYCLRKRRVNVKNLRTKVTTFAARNENGYFRINGFKVQFFPEVNEEDRAKLKRCYDLLEDLCAITASIRRGIDTKFDLAL
jgi:uncharacterized OsmC-like protein